LQRNCTGLPFYLPAEGKEARYCAEGGFLTVRIQENQGLFLLKKKFVGMLQLTHPEKYSVLTSK